MEGVIEQQVVVTSITTAVETPSTTTPPIVQPATNPKEYTLPQDLHNFIQTTAKLNRQYHTDNYILTIQQSSSGERILSIEQKSATASNKPMTQLSAQDILDTLNTPPQTPTHLQSLPSTDMIPNQQLLKSQIHSQALQDKLNSLLEHHNYQYHHPVFFNTHRIS